MTFKDLQRAIQSQSGPEPSSYLLQRLRDKPFWYFDPSRHKEKDRSHKGTCCFNHIIGLPRKDGVKKPLFDYEGVLFKALLVPGYLNNNPSSNTLGKEFPNIPHTFKEKHLWVKKATGLGVTEFMLRFMAWLCLRNDDLKGSQQVIVTGPNQELAIKLIKRMKALFEPHNIYFDSKETVLDLNGCNIQAYPSHNLGSFRSLTNPKFILIDEADFIPKFQQEEVRQVSERYIAKSDPFIVMVSTPNNPGGLFEKIEKEPFDTCIYKKAFLDYLYGVGKIYTAEEIDNARMSPSFPREYELKYIGLLGNVFSHQSIEDCQKIDYNPLNVNPKAKKSIGLDPGFGSSCFGVVATQLVNGKIQVIHGEEYERPNFAEMVNVVMRLQKQYDHVTNIYSDAANPEIIEALKREFGESTDWHYIHDQITECRKFNMPIEDRMKVVPVSFSTEGAHALQHCKWLLEETDIDGSSLVAINPCFDKLLISLRTAVATEYKLRKEETQHSDVLDALRLSLLFYKRIK